MDSIIETIVSHKVDGSPILFLHFQIIPTTTIMEQQNNHEKAVAYWKSRRESDKKRQNERIAQRNRVAKYQSVFADACIEAQNLANKTKITHYVYLVGSKIIVSPPNGSLDGFPIHGVAEPA